MADCGFSLQQVSKEVGRHENYLSELTRKDFQPPDAMVEKIRSSIKKRGVILVSFSPEKQSLSQLSQRSSLLLGRLADKLGVSRQAINSGGISDAVLQKLTNEIHSIGRKLLRIAE